MEKFYSLEQSLRQCRGQVMLLIMLFISGLILSGSAIAGLLLFYQVRGSVDLVSSAQAIYAADAGIERVLYCFYKTPLPVEPSGLQRISECNTRDAIELGNKARYLARIAYDPKNVLRPEDIRGYRVVSSGSLHNTERVLETFVSITQ